MQLIWSFSSLSADHSTCHDRNKTEIILETKEKVRCVCVYVGSFSNFPQNKLDPENLMKNKKVIGEQVLRRRIKYTKLFLYIFKDLF